MPESIEVKEFEFTVNGVQIKTAHEKLVARDILELAAKHEAMPGKPEDYDLQGENGKYKADDWVDLLEDKVFITIPHTPTPVALRR